MTTRSVRIGGASGFWGETAVGTPQLLASGNVDYLVYDCLAEITMSIMARARAADPTLGFATDFVSGIIRPNLTSIASQGVKVISNAGGVNPQACAAALRKLIEAAGLDLKVGVVTGDDLSGHADGLVSAGVREMFSNSELPPVERLASVNAYLGAFPIAAALRGGADIVVTGRVVDSAVVLGACIHEFEWSPGDLDELAGASIAGHVIECSTQATGGNFTDWHLVADDLAEIGFPIAEIHADGSFVISKPEGTGGIVSQGSVAEQLLYEIGDPQAYVLPDVVCDFSGVQLTEIGPDQVKVTGARGYPPSDTYKVSATYADGFRGGQLLFFYGFDADRKARAYAKAVLKRARGRLAQAGLPDFTETCVEVFGDESHYGAAKHVDGAREVTLKVAAKHPDQKGIGALLKEAVGAALGAPPGLTLFSAGGRPKPSPVVRLFSLLWPKANVDIAVEVDGESLPVEAGAGQPFDPATIERPPAPAPPDLSGDTTTVPLVRLAWGRSGDKGDAANIGIIARRPEYLPYIWAALTEDAVVARFSHFLSGNARRFLMPGCHAINFLLTDVLGGGGVASLRNDPQGKGYAQILLDHPIPVPTALAAALPSDRWRPASRTCCDHATVHRATLLRRRVAESLIACPYLSPAFRRTPRRIRPIAPICWRSSPSFERSKTAPRRRPTNGARHSSEEVSSRRAIAYSMCSIPECHFCACTT